VFDEIRREVEAEFSGERAKELTAAIHSYDRWSTFWQYGLCGAYCAARMRECGLEDVELMEIPADGETKFGDWAMPLAWDVEDATLEIVEPEDSVRMLAHYRQEPASLAMWSAPTPAEGTEAEVVLLEDKGKDGDYGEIDVVGKVVFASRHAGSVRKWAARRGALGVVSDYPACSEDDLAEGVCWVNAWVDYHGWGFLKIDTPMFGFTLNREKGAYLRRLLANGGSVRVRATVRSSLYEGRFTLPAGMIRGETDEEVVVYGHTYEYGAEDNASGCAVALEAARTLNKLIQAGKLPRPRRSIRFMMSWECYGSIPWCVERIHEKKNVVAGLCLDDMGGKRVLTGGKPTLVLNSHCAASFTDFAASEIAKACLREDR
jgi:aminopeptidase YwaD